jgi:uncharacterized protein YegL
MESVPVFTMGNQFAVSEDASQTPNKPDMKTIHFLSPLLVLAVVLVAGCKKEPVPTPVPKETLTISILDEFTSLPAKVSIFFKVDTKKEEPVAGLLDSDFTIYEKGRNDETERIISQDEAGRQISPNSQVFSYNSLLLLDLSGSVVNDNLEELKNASTQFVDKVMPATRDSSLQMGIYWFDGENKLHELIGLTDDREALDTAIQSISASISNDNSTDLYGAILRGSALASTILTENQDIITASSVVIFTDGTDQAARFTKQGAFDAVANADPKISFYTIGLGNEIDQDVLETIGKTSAAFADNISELVAKFEEIAQEISNEANSYYLFEYCSPKRDGSGVNELRISVRKGIATGSAQTTFDATGFHGGCSL